MSESDLFSRQLLEEAKRFLEKAISEATPEGKAAYLHAAVNLGFSALEAHVNAIADDFLVGSELTLLERSILAEKDFQLEAGVFELTDRLKMYRLEDRVQFLHRRFSGVAIDKSAGWWSSLKAGLDLRNKLTHPKEVPVIVESQTRQALEAIIETLDSLYKAIYKTPYPPARRGLQSSMLF